IAEIYSRSAITTHVGYIFVPLVWYGIAAAASINKRLQRKGVAVLGMSYGMVALSNVPLLIILSFSIALAAVAMWKEVSVRAAVRVAVGLLFGLALSAFHFGSVVSFAGQTHSEHIRGVPGNLFLTMLRGENFTTGYHVGLFYLCLAILAAG